MKTIVCYGDSNTWGLDPASFLVENTGRSARLARDLRWPGVLRQALGSGYEVIEEGLPGRTTVFEDPLEEYRSGKSYLIPCLYSHAPVDLLIIMLGTNDLKKRFALSASDIARGAGILVGYAQNSNAGPGGRGPAVLLLAPPPTMVEQGTADQEGFEGADRRSREFGTQFRQIADLYQCGFLDTASVIVSSPLDGVHLEASQHARLGLAVAENVKYILPPTRPER